MVAERRRLPLLAPFVRQQVHGRSNAPAHSRHRLNPGDGTAPFVRNDVVVLSPSATRLAKQFRRFVVGQEDDAAPGALRLAGFGGNERPLQFFPENRFGIRAKHNRPHGQYHPVGIDESRRP